jgi:8-oxo-dGTP pyrophosphatase MutT (NUDIX family)|tara:strand:+ start:501 stop:938 length:438 start_codon:yes stop_codon:yes gene_type:complete
VNFNNLVNLIILERKTSDTNRVSKIITTYNNKILMLQKRDGKFELPGGHIEVGEDAISGAKREFFEETGLDIKRLKQITANSERVLYRGIILNSNIKLSNEHKSFKFVSEKNLFKLPLSKWSKKDLAFLKPHKKTPDEEELDDEI